MKHSLAYRAERGILHGHSPAATEEELFNRLYNDGYRYLRFLDNGMLLGVMPFLYTWGLCIIECETSYFTRYCYADQVEALTACVTWNGDGDPPGNWIKQKPEGRLGPGFLTANAGAR